MHCRNCHATILRIGFAWVDVNMTDNLSELCPNAFGTEWRHDA